jgi:hypothetical protein
MRLLKRLSVLWLFLLRLSVLEDLHTLFDESKKTEFWSSVSATVAGVRSDGLIRSRQACIKKFKQLQTAFDVDMEAVRCADDDEESFTERVMLLEEIEMEAAVVKQNLGMLVGDAERRYAEALRD